MPELDPYQQLSLIEMLFANGNISKEEWRTAVFTQIGTQEQHAAEEDERVTEDRVRQLREAYGAGGAVPRDLLDEREMKIWDRLFGSDSLRALEQLETEEIDGSEEEGAVQLLREGEDGLEEVELEEEEHSVAQKHYITGNERLAADIENAMAGAEGEQDDVYEDDLSTESEFVGLKPHPLTIANRFGTHPSTIELPKSELVNPITAILARVAPVHIAEAANRVFGGAGLPYSTSTPNRAKQMQQKPIGLDAYQPRMAPIDGDAYMAVLIPGIYASVISVLTETRKRLGTAWAEQLVRKAQKGELKILDAGGGGAGVLAVREVLRAEWERMHADQPDSSTDVAAADGRIGGPGASPPLGSATVLTGSDALRLRASQLLDNTTFIPRLPDYLHTEEARLHGKFDIVIAPHTLWPLKEDFLRKAHVQNLWSLLSSSGGVLLLLEKGVPRGFELIAGAREMLLDTRIARPDGPEDLPPLGKSTVVREPGMILAPCTNHQTCPMYHQKGIVKGRREICSFAQRYHRPPFLQKIYGTRGRNHEDVEFSYLSLMRGRDLREESTASDAATPVIRQDAESTTRAFQGYGEDAESRDDTMPPLPHSLSLPRAVFPPLKRKGHVILDLCTPAGTLERWTVPRSFSKQAFRDARKCAWGDLWALGAKTRVPRNVKVGMAKFDLDVKGRVVLDGEGGGGDKGRKMRDARSQKKDKWGKHDKGGRFQEDGM